MNKQDIFSLAEEFSKETHGKTDYDKDETFIMGQETEHYAPLKFIQKKLEGVSSIEDLQKLGFVCSSYEHAEKAHFKNWYEKQFQKKPLVKVLKKIQVFYIPDHVSVFNSLEAIFKNYEVLRHEKILVNGKNLPVQVGEWYAKGIFGLSQVRSTSMRGFDFLLNNKKVEVKVHWSDSSSPKGVKVKKSSIELADYVILMHVSSNFMIRDICFLDSDFVLRKFSGKGHAVFLKDSELSGYFFSKSEKHFDKVVNKNALMTFASPSLSLKLSERI